jgi:hypothetical protein
MQSTSGFFEMAETTIVPTNQRNRGLVVFTVGVVLLLIVSAGFYRGYVASAKSTVQEHEIITLPGRYPIRGSKWLAEVVVERDKKELIVTASHPPFDWQMPTTSVEFRNMKIAATHRFPYEKNWRIVISEGDRTLRYQCGSRETVYDCSDLNNKKTYESTKK